MSRTAILGGLPTKLGLGGLSRRYYHDPMDKLRLIIRSGGPFEQHRTELARLEMVQAASRLTPLAPRSETHRLEVSVLSGTRYWYQTLFCAYSLQLHSWLRIEPTIYDDGSLTAWQIEQISRAIPWAKFVSAEEIRQQLDIALPSSRFPSLRNRRISYPHLRKLTDIQIWNSGWSLVLDSDMLFFREPTELLNWGVQPCRPCHMIDILPTYGYSPGLLRELAGRELPELVNVGIVGLLSSHIDWDHVEYCCRRMLEDEGANYYQEQAIMAILLAGADCIGLSKQDYILCPSLEEAKSPSAALHHYVSESRRGYFQHTWKIVRDLSQTSPSI